VATEAVKPTLVKVKVKVNGEEREAEVEPRLLLAHFLRETLGLTGTHVGFLDGRPVKSCTIFAVQVQGREVMTVEGLEQQGKLHPIQEGFWQEHGLQCGFCTPGMMLTGYALLQRNQNPSEEEVRRAISGNLCRCTGYVNIVKAIQYAAQKMREGGS
jgi:carbon-monoxide dehydrogenase small subunit